MPTRKAHELFLPRVRLTDEQLAEQIEEWGRVIRPAIKDKALTPLGELNAFENTKNAKPYTSLAANGHDELIEEKCSFRGIWGPQREVNRNGERLAVKVWGLNKKGEWILATIIHDFRSLYSLYLVPTHPRELFTLWEPESIMTTIRQTVGFYQRKARNEQETADRVAATLDEDIQLLNSSAGITIPLSLDAFWK